MDRVAVGIHLASGVLQLGCDTEQARCSKWVEAACTVAREALMAVEGALDDCYLFRKECWAWLRFLAPMMFVQVRKDQNKVVSTTGAGCPEG